MPDPEAWGRVERAEGQFQGRQQLGGRQAQPQVSIIIQKFPVISIEYFPV
jgi:hypothetical protein